MTLSRAEYVALDGLGVADLIRRREVTGDEVYARAIELATALNPKLNAFVELFEQPLAYNPDGPFGGVPFAIKDLICHAEGRLNENGSRLSAGTRCTHDTDLMRRFRVAGCMTIGRTTAPEFGYCATTESVFSGPTRNPWDLSRMPGGSSGGSGAAVAAGIVPLAHGNDGGGSIRIPAACNGLVGLKTSRGRVPIGPDIGEAVNGLAIEFGITRTVRDCAALLDAVHGAALGDPYSIAPPPGRYSDLIRTPPSPLRVAIMTKAWSGVPVDPVMTEGAETAARLCEGLGHEVTEAAPPLDAELFMTATHTIWISCVHHLVNSVAASTGRQPSADTLEATTLTCFLEGAKVNADQLQAAFDAVNQITRSFARFFTDYDVLLTPTLARPALLLGTLNANNGTLDARGWTEQIFAFAPFTPQFNMTGQPAISLPLHRTAELLPVGVQFAARYGQEHTLLQLAAQLEAVAPWPRLAPLWQQV
ncbi:MAG: amidase [Gammaproteobacteria bacterium]|nr:amidase [Gammaproteobacteria bacterium]